MAKVYRFPEDGPQFRYNWSGRYDYDEYEKASDNYEAECRAFCEQNGSGDLCGKILRHQVADGYAQYMVLKHRPFTIMWMAGGDAYNAGAVWERGLRLSDARDMIRFDSHTKRLGE